MAKAHAHVDVIETLEVKRETKTTIQLDLTPEESKLVYSVLLAVGEAHEGDRLDAMAEGIRTAILRAQINSDTYDGFFGTSPQFLTIREWDDKV